METRKPMDYYLYMYENDIIKLKDIPLQRINKKLLSLAAKKEPNRFLSVVIKLYESGLFVSLPFRITDCFKMIDNKYLSKEFYLKLYMINPIDVFTFIPTCYLTQEMCNEFFWVNPKRNFYRIPYKFKTKEMYQEFYKDNFVDYFMNLPSEFITQDDCDKCSSEYLVECFDYIPVKFITKNMCLRYFDSVHTVDSVKRIPSKFRTKEMWKMLITHENYISDFEMIPKKMLDQDMCDIFFDRFTTTAFSYIPDEFKTYEMCMVMIMCTDDANILKQIPTRVINQSMSNLMFDKYQERALEYIPIEFVTKDMYRLAISKDVVKYYRLLLKHFRDEDIISIVVFELNKLIKQNKTIDMDFSISIYLVKLYPNLLRVFNADVRNYVIKNELYLLMNDGGTLKSIVDKYNITSSMVSDVLEGIKTENYEAYNKIKKILENNEITHFYNLISSINILGNVILSLGSLKDKSLSIEQKIKFAYLYRKCIRVSLDELYLFNKRFCLKGKGDFEQKEMFDKAKLIDIFFKRFFKFNYVYNENMDITGIPENRTILLNNSWIQWYSRNKFFAIKDGVPTMEYKYGSEDNVLTMELSDKIINRLKDAGIPLVDVIVQGAFREYFKGNLDTYILSISKYDEEIDKINSNKKR